MNLLSHSKLLFIGDSITDAGRGATGESAAWESQFGLGQGYVSMVSAWLGGAHPNAAIRVVNKGNSGHTVRDLASRWEKDVIAERPDALCIMVGINDVWRQFDSPLRPELAVPPAEYRNTLSHLVATAKPHLKELYMATPYFIEPNREDPMRARMDEYGEIVREIATESVASFIDTQAAFDKVLVHVHPTSLAWDRIHPSPVGHMVLARAFLQSFGCL
jgi:lysophospholipase L1-like esterase